MFTYCLIAISKIWCRYDSRRVLMFDDGRWGKFLFDRKLQFAQLRTLMQASRMIECHDWILIYRIVGIADLSPRTN